MDDENGDNQGFGWVVWAAGGAVVVVLLLFGAAVLLGVVRVPFIG